MIVITILILLILSLAITFKNLKYKKKYFQIKKILNEKKISFTTINKLEIINNIKLTQIPKISGYHKIINFLKENFQNEWLTIKNQKLLATYNIECYSIKVWNKNIKDITILIQDYNSDEHITNLKKDCQLQNNLQNILLLNFNGYIWCKDQKNNQIIYINKKDEISQQIIHQTCIDSTYKIMNNNQIKIFHSFQVNTINNLQIFYTKEITNQIENQKILENQIEMYKNLLESSSNAVAFFDKNCKLAYFNNVFAKFWEFKHSWLESMPQHEQIIDHLISYNKISPENIKEYRSWNKQIFYSLQHTHNEFFHLNDGRTIRMVIIPNKNGGLLFNYEDLSERLNTQRDYQMMIKIYNNIFNCIDEPIIVLKENAKIFLYNNAYLEFIQSNDIHQIDKYTNIQNILQLLNKKNQIKDFNLINQKILTYINDNNPHLLNLTLNLTSEIIDMNIYLKKIFAQMHIIFFKNIKYNQLNFDKKHIKKNQEKLYA